LAQNLVLMNSEGNVMPAKPGQRPPNAGKRGRKPGTPNKVTRTTRELFSAFVDHNAEKAQALFDRVARKNPAMALRILSNFAEFSLPRLQRTELDATISATPAYLTLEHVTDPVEASRIYQEMIRAGKRAYNPNVQLPRSTERPAPTQPTLAAPAPSVPAHAEAPEPPAARPATATPTAEAPPARQVPAPRPAAVDPEDPTVVAVVEEPLRHAHFHKPLSDSPCAGCRALWIRG
jgi:hypothetical protein